MQSEKKKDLKNIFILIILFLITVLILTRFKFLYGSTMDWDSQHLNFANYFRQLFYKTKNLFPSFAFNLGAGQNIYNFSYYGLYNPFLILSYFFPFLDMATYLISITIISIIISIIFFYKWLRKHLFSANLSFLITFLFLFSAPLILHSHRQIMFINYFPFLIGGLYSVDAYFASSRKLGLTLSTFFLIMISFYYSIPSILVLIIYGIYTYIKKNPSLNLSSFLKEGIKFLIPIFIGILSSSLLILPTLYTIFSGRSQIQASLNLFSLIIPQVNLSYFLYSSYSLGLTAILVIAILYLLTSSSKENKFLGWTFSIICLFPLICYLLNGKLYIYAKVFIPFLPLGCYTIALFLKDLFANKVKLSKVLFLTIIISILAYFTNWSSYYLFIVEIIILSFALLLYSQKKWRVPLMSIIIVSTLINFIIPNYKDELLPISTYQYIYTDDINAILSTIKADNVYRSSLLIDTLTTSNTIPNTHFLSPNIYSSGYNSDYKNFYQNIFNNEMEYPNHLTMSASLNPLYNFYMGVRYILTETKIPYGYTKINTLGTYNLYENPNVLPLGYVSSNLMSITDFENLTYPYTLEALLKYTIVSSAPSSNFKPTIEEYSLPLEEIDLSNLEYEKLAEGIRLKAHQPTALKLNLPADLTDKLLIIRFNMNYESTCSFGDTYITINDVTNLLSCRTWRFKNENKTFDYVITPHDNLEINLSAGTFEISDIKTYIFDYQELLNLKDNIDIFKINKDETKGDIIVGDITTSGGYFTLSIPYDKGFNIYVNDKLTPYEKVNTSFIGFPIKAGTYHLQIKYVSPYKKLGFILSSIGITLTIIIGIIDKKRGRKKCPKI